MSAQFEMPSNKTFLFKDAPWLGGKHDGYPLVLFKDYNRTRPKVSGTYLGRESAAELQSLLTFGLLEAVMEVKVPEFMLLQVDSSSGTMVVTSGNHLEALLQDWRHRIRQLGSGELCRQWFDRVQTALKQARGLLMMETMKPRYSSFQRAGLQPRELGDVLLQIGSLAEAVVASSMAFPHHFPRQGFSWGFILAPARQLRADMVAKGWCPSTIQMMSESACMLGYASTCDRPHMRKEMTAGHEQCSTHYCALLTVDTSNYTPQHITETCNCDMYRPSLDDVVGLLAAGKIPVVHCPAPRDSLHTCESSEMPYVAISHVWADGLRSTTEEGLPACQIKRLSAMASHVMPGGAFWIDTLCIPKIQHIRTRAIELMAETYRGAAAVLVLDSGMRQTSCSAPREQKLMCVLCSAWMQRLWTLQEGLLAQKLFFEFSDGLVAVDDILPVGEQHFITLWLHLASDIYRLTKLQGAYSSEFHISDVANFLRWRATSNASDETLAISGLVNVNAGELAALDHPDQRMQTFLLRIHKLPSNIIFLSGPKLDVAGFHWAPKTFLRGVESSLGFNVPEGLCTPTGFVAEYAAVYFKVTTLDNECEWCIRDLSKQRIYKITDTWLGPEDVKAGYAPCYTCSVILLMDLPKPSETIFCAAVHVDERMVLTEPGEEDRFLCKFKKRMLLTDISQAEFSKEKVQTIVTAKSGRMRVKVV